MNMHPTGQMSRDDRLSAITGDDGIANCGNAQNCVRVCPMSIPLTKAIYEENRETIIHGLFGWLRNSPGEERPHEYQKRGGRTPRPPRFSSKRFPREKH